LWLNETFSYKLDSFNGLKTTSGQLYGESYIMRDRGPSNDELHVLMSWSEHNVSAIGTVEGHMVEETSELIVYNHNIIPFLSNVIII